MILLEIRKPALKPWLFDSKARVFSAIRSPSLLQVFPKLINVQRFPQHHVDVHCRVRISQLSKMSSAPSFGVTLPKYQQPKAGTCLEQHLPFRRVPTPFTRWPGVSLSLSHTHTAPQLPGDACGDSDLLSIPPADRGREGQLPESLGAVAFPTFHAGDRWQWKGRTSPPRTTHRGIPGEPI